MTYTVSSGTLNSSIPYHTIPRENKSNAEVNTATLSLTIDFLYRLLCVSSQMSAFSSAKCRAGRPLRNLVTGQSSTICIIVCRGAPIAFWCSYIHRSGQISPLLDRLLSRIKTHWICINPSNTLWQSGVDMSTTVHPVATFLDVVSQLGGSCGK